MLSAIRLEVDPEPAPPPLVARVRSSAPAFEPAPARAPATEPPPPSPFLEALVAGLDEAAPRELDSRLCRAAALEQSLLARIGPLLFALARARGPFALGFRSLDAYARERVGISPRRARALLRVERACALASGFAAAWRSGRLRWSQAQLLVPLLQAPGSEPFHEAWLVRAAAFTVRRLEDDVDHALASGCLDPALLPALPGLPAGVQIGAEHRDWEETLLPPEETDF